MLVGEIMCKDIVTVCEEDIIIKALRLMVEYKIRHLPVVQKASPQKLVGFLTGHDIKRGMTGEDEETPPRLKDVMHSKVLTVSSRTLVQDASRILVVNRIGGLPVVDDGKLVGIITSHDILAIFIEMMDALQKSSRIDVLVTKHGDVEVIRELLQSEECQILGIGMVPDTGDDLVYSIRIERTDTTPLCNLLHDAGYTVREHFS